MAVLARNVGSTKSYEVYRTNYRLVTPASAVTLTPNVASPGTVGNTIKFTAAASGGSGKYEYKLPARAGRAQVLRAGLLHIGELELEYVRAGGRARTRWWCTPGMSVRRRVTRLTGPSTMCW